MSQMKFFVLALIYLLIGAQCLFAEKPKTVIVFKGNQTVVPYSNTGGNVITRKPLSFRVPALVSGIFGGKELLLSLCDVRYNSWSDWGDVEIGSAISYGDYSQWGNPEIVVQNARKGTHPVAGDPTAVIKGNKVYAIVGRWAHSPHSWAAHRSGQDWDSLLVVGVLETSHTPEGESKATVKWSEPVSLKHLLPQSVDGWKGHQFVGGVGNGVVMDDGTIVIPVQAALRQGGKTKVVASMIYSKDDGVTWQMGGFSEPGPSEASIVEWGKGKLLLSTRVDNGPRKVYETDNFGATMTEFVPLSDVWGNQANRKGPGSQASFITIPVGDTKVMLFAHPLNTIGRYARDRLQMWMSDGQRIFHVGEISDKNEGERAGYSILAYVGESLYCMYEINPFDMKHNEKAPVHEWDRILAIRKLTEMLDTVKATVHQWKDQDKILEEAGVPSKGLVGLLSTSESDSKWTDVYKCVDAIVTNAEKVEGGYRFGASAGGWARWPVASQAQNQRYYFTRRVFAIAATVCVSGATAKDDSLIIGASSDNNGKNTVIGLGYTQDRRWYILYDNTEKVLSDKPFEADKPHHVVLMVSNGVGSAFVDGNAIMQETSFKAKEAQIAHFYFGSRDGTSQDKDSRVSVANVALYNRVLNPTEVHALFQYFGEGVTAKKLPTIPIEPKDEVQPKKALPSTNPMESQGPSQSNEKYPPPPNDVSEKGKKNDTSICHNCLTEDTNDYVSVNMDSSVFTLISAQMRLLLVAASSILIVL